MSGSVVLVMRLRLYLGEDPTGGPDAPSDSTEAGRTVVSKLWAAVRCLERHVLSVLGAEQGAERNLTVHNQAGHGILARNHDKRSDRTLLLDRFRTIAEQTEGLDTWPG